MKSLQNSIRCKNKDRRSFVKSNISTIVQKQILDFVEEINDEVDDLSAGNYCDCEIKGPCSMHGDD